MNSFKPFKNKGIKGPSNSKNNHFLWFSREWCHTKAQTGTTQNISLLITYSSTVAHRCSSRTNLPIIAPTRELVKQISWQQRNRYHLNVDIPPSYRWQNGWSTTTTIGTSPSSYLVRLARLIDHAKRGSFTLDCIRRVVLDETDQMLHMGFLPDNENLISQTDANKTTLLFSASIPDKIRNLLKSLYVKTSLCNIEGKACYIRIYWSTCILMNQRKKQNASSKWLKKTIHFLAIVSVINVKVQFAYP